MIEAREYMDICEELSRKLAASEAQVAALKAAQAKREVLLHLADELARLVEANTGVPRYKRIAVALRDGLASFAIDSALSSTAKPGEEG